MSDSILVTKNKNIVTGTENLHRVNPASGYIAGLKSPKSRLVMRSYLNKVAESFGVQAPEGEDAYRYMPWENLDRYELLAFIESLRNAELSPDTVRVYLSAVKGVMREAKLQGRIDADHLERIRDIKGGRGERLSKGRRLLPEEIKPLLEACFDGSVKGARDAALISLLLENGLRRSEVVALEMKNLTRNRNEIRVIGKGDKERKAFLPALTVKLLGDWIDGYRGHDKGKIFLRIRKNDDIEFKSRRKNKRTGRYELVDGGLTSQAVLHILERRAAIAGIDRFSPHDLRRTLATTLFEQKVDALTIQRIMGHANLETTERYDMRGEDTVKSVQTDFSYEIHNSSR
jgi:integrase